jgi:uncharacterized protein
VATRLADARALDLRALCRDGVTRQGRWPLRGLARLGTALYATPPEEASVEWAAQGTLRAVAGAEPELWLHLQAEAGVVLQCQRCLQAMPQPLGVDRRFRFVRGEDEAARLDEETEDDDVLALPDLLDLRDLVEDELILALPLVPRHDGPCPEPLPQPANDDSTDRAAEAEHPFAALAALRARPPRVGEDGDDGDDGDGADGAAG